MFYNFGSKLGEYDLDISIDSDDRKYFLNEAQLQFIKNRFDPENPRIEGFEQSQKRIDELKPLYVKDKSFSCSYLSSNAGTKDAIVFRASPNDKIMYIVSYRANIEYPENKSDINNGIINNSVATRTYTVNSRYSQSDDIYKLLKDPFNKPSKLSPIVDINENNVDIYSDGSFIVNELILNYIKEPQEIVFISSGDAGNQDCELPDFTHTDIINIAVNLFLESRGKLNSQKQDN